MNESTHEIEGVRRSALFGDIVTLRLACNLPGDGDEALFRMHYGPQGSFLFWGNFLSGVLTSGTFIQHVSQARAERWDRIDVIRMAIEKALLEAYQAEATFFKAGLSELEQVNYFWEIKNPERIKLLGRKAAEWLLSSPEWQHIVPRTLAAFLRGEKPKADPLLAGRLPKARTGPKGNLTKNAADKMFEHLRSGSLTFEDLKEMKQDDLAGRYGVRSRDTAIRARDKALARLAAEINSDK